jgi:hypothetical protein
VAAHSACPEQVGKRAGQIWVACVVLQDKAALRLHMYGCKAPKRWSCSAEYDRLAADGCLLTLLEVSHGRHVAYQSADLSIAHAGAVHHADLASGIQGPA